MSATRLFAALFLCLTLGTAVHADDRQSASAFANDLGHRSLAVITDPSLSKADKQAKLEALFQQNVDVEGIGKFVLGRYWRTATDAQKQDYLASYRTFTIKHYTTNLSDFTNADFEVSRVRPDDHGGNIVTMRIKRPQAEDVVTDFDVRPQPDGSLKVYDIIVEGVSMITTQRSEFGSVVAQHGLDYLIGELKRRAAVGPADSGNAS